MLTNWKYKKGIWKFVSDSFEFLSYKERMFLTGGDDGGNVRSLKGGGMEGPLGEWQS